MSAIKDMLMSGAFVVVFCGIAIAYPPALEPMFWMMTGSAITLIVQNAMFNRRVRKFERLHGRVL